MSKVRDWLSPVLWGTPKARSEEDEEADRELDENNEINADVSEQLQQVKLLQLACWLPVMTSILYWS